MTDKTEKEFTIIVNSTAVLAIGLGVIGCASGAIGLEFAKTARENVEDEEDFTAADRTKERALWIFVAISALSILVAIFYMVRGRRLITEAWKNRSKKAVSL